MKKLKAVNVLVLVLFLFSNMAYAEDIAGKIGVGANWFYYLSNDDEWDVFDVDIENEDTAEVFNLHASYCLPNITDPVNLNVVLDYERISRDITIDEDTGPYSDDFGELTMNLVMLTLQVRLSNLGKFTPYIGAGLGYSFNSISEGDITKDLEDIGLWVDEDEVFVPVEDVDLDVDDSFCFKIPLGVDMFITDNLALNAEAKYFYTKPDVKGDVDGVGWSEKKDDDLDQSTFAFGAGLNYYF